MKADNEADAEKQDWPDWQTGGRQVADWDAGRAMSNVEHVHPLALRCMAHAQLLLGS